MGTLFAKLASKPAAATKPPASTTATPPPVTTATKLPPTTTAAKPPTTTKPPPATKAPPTTTTTTKPQTATKPPPATTTATKPPPATTKPPSATTKPLPTSKPPTAITAAKPTTTNPTTTGPSTNAVPDLLTSYDSVRFRYICSVLGGRYMATYNDRVVFVYKSGKTLQFILLDDGTFGSIDSDREYRTYMGTVHVANALIPRKFPENIGTTLAYYLGNLSKTFCVENCVWVRRFNTVGFIDRYTMMYHHGGDVQTWSRRKMVPVIIWLRAEVANKHESQYKNAPVKTSCFSTVVMPVRMIKSVNRENNRVYNDTNFPSLREEVAYQAFDVECERRRRIQERTKNLS